MEGQTNSAFSTQDEEISRSNGSMSPEMSNKVSVQSNHNVRMDGNEVEMSQNHNKTNSDQQSSSNNEISEVTLPETLNDEIIPMEYHREMSDNSPRNAHFRRKIPLKSEICNDETDFSDKMFHKDLHIPTTKPNGVEESLSWKKVAGFWIHNNFSRYRSAAHIVMIWFLHLCVLAYVITAITFWNMQGECDLEWCDGLGMLIIIVVLTYFGLAYYYIIKKFYRKSIHKMLIPLHSKWNTLTEYRYIKIVTCMLPFIAIIVYLGIDTIGSSERLISCLGTAVIIILGFIFSKHRRQVKWRPVLCGLGIQFLLGLITIRWSVGRSIFQCLGDKATTFLSYSNQGARFVYGNDLIDQSVFAFQPMSVIFFLSFIVQILYYYGVMQWVVIKMGWLIQVTMGTTVCESVNSAASIFLGMSESPLLFKPYLKDLTKSELHAVMTGGFATVAGSVMAAYISFGVEPAHLITASVMSAPAALCYSKLFYPETEESKNKAESMTIEKSDESSVLDAASKGALAGIQLVLGIIANIIAFISFIAFLNGVLSWLGMLVRIEGLTFELILGKVFIPLSWIMGVEWKECEDVARLIGLKTIVNEFVGYEQLGKLKIAGKLSPRSEMIATYALCGFSNPGSIGISIGALVTMAPNQRSAVTEVAFRAFLAGSATCFLTACIAGMLMPNDYFPDSTKSSVLPIFNISTQVP